MNIDRAAFDTLVDQYISFALSVRGSSEYRRLSPVFEQVDEMCQVDPQSTWAFILAALARDTSREFTEHLSAGLLEDFLARHGRAMIEAVEQEAERNPAFSMLLGGVCEDRIDADIWSRIDAVMDHRGWQDAPGE